MVAGVTVVAAAAAAAAAAVAVANTTTITYYCLATHTPRAPLQRRKQ